MAEGTATTGGTTHTLALDVADYCSGQYLMPVDDKEQERLDIMHTMILAARPKRHRLHHAPLREMYDPETRQGTKVLDLGHGTGIWLLDMAERYAEAHTEFHGVDLSNMAPRHVLPRVNLYQHVDFESPMALGEDSFDLIHMQMGLGSVANWPLLYQKIYKHLKPGGWFEHVEIDWTPRCEDNTLPPGKLQDWWHLYVKEPYNVVGRPIEYNHNTGGLLAAAGFYIPPDGAGHMTFRIPMNGWSNRTREEHVSGTWWETAMSFGEGHGHGFEALSMAVLTRVQRWSADHARKLCEDAMTEASNPTIHAFNVLHVEGLIAEGRKIVIVDGHVVKADAWCPYHPGGETAILHMVGRDGTDEIRALHSAETQAFMQKFVIGKIEGQWDNFLPPIQGGTFRKPEETEQASNEQPGDEIAESSSSASSTSTPSPLFESTDGMRRRRRSSVSSASSFELPGNDVHSKPLSMDEITSQQLEADLRKYPALDRMVQDDIVTKYRALDDQLRDAGLYKCPYTAYAFEGLRYLALFTSFALSIHYGQYALAGLFLGLFWHQLVFTAHDAGHMGITHDFHTDTCIGIFIADFLGGLSIGWWKRNHNVHHIVTNSPEHDPDIEHMPFFAISHRFFDSLRSTYYDRIMDFDAVAQCVVKYQHYLYYPLLCFGRFNLYRLSWAYLLSPTQAPRKGPAWWHRYLEIAGNLFFWYWFGYQTLYLRIPTWSSRLAFIMISHMVTAPLHVQITLSHFAMSTADLGTRESFPQKMLRTTMDVDCPQWLDFVHGGLQFQAVHHLYPRIPRHNLRKAQPMVVKFCDEVKVPYTIYGFTKGNQEVIGRLSEVAKQVEIYEACRKVAAKDLVEGHDHRH
ncbi:hypothetical protein LTR64_001445 [Lithohypha guttulata]|uniref:uncharacterized protein n=1 Tax=Lithohypha guttulata TaxID=1690604 RepID=UPI002DE05CDC|nr:hypothetical protein LTR51_003639 [Lithohypha guttulata]